MMSQVTSSHKSHVAQQSVILHHRALNPARAAHLPSIVKRDSEIRWLKVRYLLLFLLRQFGQVVYAPSPHLQHKRLVFGGWCKAFTKIPPPRRIPQNRWFSWAGTRGQVGGCCLVFLSSKRCAQKCKTLTIRQDFICAIEQQRNLIIFGGFLQSTI